MSLVQFVFPSLLFPELRAIVVLVIQEIMALAIWMQFSFLCRCFMFACGVCSVVLCFFFGSFIEQIICISKNLILKICRIQYAFFVFRTKWMKILGVAKNNPSKGENLWGEREFINNTQYRSAVFELHTSATIFSFSTFHPLCSIF